MTDNANASNGAKKKLNVSPLPQQTEDYSRYEETYVRWDRIAFVGVIVLVLVLGIYQLFATDEDDSPSGNAQAIESTPPVAVLDAVETPVKEIDPAPVETSLSASSSKVEKNVTMEKSGKSSEAVSAAQEESARQEASNLDESNQADEKAITENQVAVTNPVAIKHPGITKAQLTSTLKDDVPVDMLGGTIPMSQEGIIKVVLYTEMNKLRGTWLRHIWYRDGVEQAMIKIPVNADSQRSSSSKFINAQMLGQWRVNVVDDDQQLYAQAKFTVVPF